MTPTPPFHLSPKYSFAENLRLFGPGNAAPPCRPEEAVRYCEYLTQTHYENFTVAGFLVPKELRRPMQIVYAYCRWSDDLADENDGTEESRRRSLELLDWWQKGLDDCFHGETPRHPVFIALRETVRTFRLSKKPFSDLLVAFRRDQVQRNYETLDDLIDYCRCSADPVGRIVLQLVYGCDRFRDAQTEPTSEQLAWSDTICTGLQLANFWQDVARDSAVGRCYLPREFVERFGATVETKGPAGTLTISDDPPFRQMLAALVADARQRLRSGEPLIDSVPKPVRIDIALFLRGGLAILDAIEKNGYNVLVKRPVVSGMKKVRLLLGAWLANR